LGSNFAHEILGIPADSTLEEIKEAYRILAKYYHPDTSQEEPWKFVKINSAYDALKKWRDEQAKRPPTRKASPPQQTQARPQNHSTTQPPRSERPRPKNQPVRPVKPGEYGRVEDIINSSKSKHDLPSFFSLTNLAVTETQRIKLIEMTQKKRATFIMADIKAATKKNQLVSITSLERSAEQNEIGSDDLAKLLQAVQKKRFDFLISEIATAQQTYYLPSLDSIERSFEEREINEQQFNAIKEKIQTKFYKDVLDTIAKAKQSFYLPSPNSVDTLLRDKRINQTQHTELMSKLQQKNFVFLKTEIAKATQSWDLPKLHTFDFWVQMGKITSQQASELTISVNARREHLLNKKSGLMKILRWVFRQ